ncbi:MAG: hypothetical protein LBI71_00150 [Enterobacteriaceae bacterium]|jgi:hypothetical protein|nr:hypothetical protein [Enterobacteriaceae bacterium]
MSKVNKSDEHSSFIDYNLSFDLTLGKHISDTAGDQEWGYMTSTGVYSQYPFGHLTIKNDSTAIIKRIDMFYTDVNTSNNIFFRATTYPNNPTAFEDLKAILLRRTTVSVSYSSASAGSYVLNPIDASYLTDGPKESFTVAYVIDNGSDVDGLAPQLRDTGLLKTFTFTWSA